MAFDFFFFLIKKENGYFSSSLFLIIKEEKVRFGLDGTDTELAVKIIKGKIRHSCHDLRVSEVCNF